MRCYIAPWKPSIIPKNHANLPSSSESHSYPSQIIVSQPPTFAFKAFWAASPVRWKGVMGPIRTSHEGHHAIMTAKVPFKTFLLGTKPTLTFLGQKKNVQKFQHLWSTTVQFILTHQNPSTNNEDQWSNKVHDHSQGKHVQEIYTQTKINIHHINRRFLGQDRRSPLWDPNDNPTPPKKKKEKKTWQLNQESLVDYGLLWWQHSLGHTNCFAKGKNNIQLFQPKKKTCWTSDLVVGPSICFQGGRPVRRMYMTTPMDHKSA